MHPVTFQLKRAHLGAVAVGRRILGDVGVVRREARQRLQGAVMTPARFDVLFVLFDGSRVRNPLRNFGLTKRVRPPDDYQCTQAWIQKRLGLHVSTVSKMITRLVKLGLLNASVKGRTRVVCFTEEGLRLFRQALGYVFGHRYLSLLFRGHVWPRKKPPRSRKRWQLHEAVFVLFRTIKSVAYILGSRAETVYRLRRINDIEELQTYRMGVYRRERKDMLARRAATARAG